MTDEALIAYIAGRLEALLACTGKYDAVAAMSCDLKMFQRECEQLCDICFRHLEKKDGKGCAYD